jgi:hypothetical protein
MIDRQKNSQSAKFTNKSGVKHTEQGSLHPGAPQKDIKAINAVNTPKKAPGSTGSM